jgi:hypothetical protein
VEKSLQEQQAREGIAEYNSKKSEQQSQSENKRKATTFRAKFLEKCSPDKEQEKELDHTRQKESNRKRVGHKNISDTSPKGCYSDNSHTHYRCYQHRVVK